MKFLVFQLLIPLVYPIPDSQGFKRRMSQSEKPPGFEKEVLHSLRLPHVLAKEDLSRWGGKVYGPLKTLAFNEKIPMKTRWKSFMVYTQMAGVESVPVINQALEHKAWFMRSAALTALERIDKSSARIWAFRKLNNDPALMVRAKALEILGKGSDDKTTDLFWKKLHSPDSFHNSKGLWIRQTLAVSLVANPRKKDVHRWVRLLYESDGRLQQFAMLALSRINNYSSVNRDMSFWKSQYPNPGDRSF